MSGASTMMEPTRMEFNMGLSFKGRPLALQVDMKLRTIEEERDYDKHTSLLRCSNINGRIKVL